MENNSIDQLISILLISPEDKILSQLSICLQQISTENVNLILSNSFQSFFELEHWAWNILSKDTREWHENQHEYFQLFSSLSSFNIQLIFSTHNINTKTSLLLPIEIDCIEKIFQQINKRQKNTDRFLLIINTWLFNLALLIHEYLELTNHSLIIYLNEYFISDIILSEQFLDYINEFKYSSSIITSKQLFYLKISLFFLTNFILSKPDNYFYDGQQILQYLVNDYTNLILIHSQTVSSWSEELLGCITHLIALINVCHQWIGFDERILQLFILSDKTLFDYLDSLIAIINNRHFFQSIKTNYENDQTILIINLLELFKYLIHFSSIRTYFRLKQVNLFDTFVLLNQSNNIYISLLTYSLQYRILRENEFQQLNSFENLIEKCFLFLEQQSNKQYVIENILKDLLYFSQYDFIKETIIQSNHLNFLIDLTEQYFLVYEILFSLSFDRRIQDQLRQNETFLKRLKLNSTKINSAIQWNINEENIQTNIHLNKENKHHYDIFLSYSLKSKSFSKQLYTDLIDRQYRVWIDLNTESFTPNIDCILEAIEQSHFFLLCITEDYKENSFCRLQAQYAYDKQIKIIPILIEKSYYIDGWIYNLIGNLFSIDFTTFSYSQSIEILLNELKNPHISVLDAMVIRHQPQNIRNASIVINFSNKNIQQWTSINVQQWLKENQLNHMSRILIDMNGENLLDLNKLIQKNSAEENFKYFQEISRNKTEENVSLFEISRLRFLIEAQIQRENHNQTKTPSNYYSRICCRTM